MSRRKQKDGQTLLHRVAKANSADVLEYLVSLGADINAMTIYGETPLFHAVEDRNDPAVKYLMSQGADVNAKNYLGVFFLAIEQRK